MKSAQQLIGSLKAGASVSTAAQLKPALDKQLKQAGEALKGIILTFIQAQHQHTITTPDSEVVGCKWTRS